MAENESNLKIKVGAEDKTGDVFNKVGEKMKTLEAGTGSLSSSLAKLGVAGLAIYAVYEGFNFFKEAGTAAAEDAQATRLLNAQVQNLGITYSDVSGKIQTYIQRMFSLGQEDSDTTQGLTQLLRVTKGVDDAMQLSTLASDLAASGIHTYAENVDMLQKILLGKGVRALTEYGIAINDDATIIEQLASVQKLVTRTTEEMATDSDGQIKIMQTSWAELKENMGQLTIWMETDFAVKFNGVMQSLAGGSKNWAKSVAENLNIVGSFFKNIWDLATGKGLDYDAWVKDLAKQQVQFDKLWSNVTGTSTTAKNGKKEALTFSEQLTKALNNTGTAAKQTADKLQSAFTDFSKSVVGAFNDQANAIQDLRTSLRDLDAELSDSVGKSNEKYKQDVVNLARKSKEQIVKLDEQIASEKQSMGQGWRTRIAEFENQKQKEQSIIDKAAGTVGNIQAEAQKDDFILLQEAHAKELAELQLQFDKKKKLMDDEIKAREDYMKKVQASVLAPGAYEKITSQGASFLGSIGASGTQQQLIFNFNAGVVGDTGIKKLINDTIAELNRQATLRGIGGK